MGKHKPDAPMPIEKAEPVQPHMKSQPVEQTVDGPTLDVPNTFGQLVTIIKPTGSDFAEDGTVNVTVLAKHAAHLPQGISERLVWQARAQLGLAANFNISGVTAPIAVDPKTHKPVQSLTGAEFARIVRLVPGL